MNITIMSGRAVKEPTTREIMRNGKPSRVANFRIAVTRPYKVDGENPTDFYQVECWGALADVAEKYVTKGKYLTVTGVLDAHPSKGEYEGQEVIYKNMSLRCKDLELGPGSFESELERRTEASAMPAAPTAPVMPAAPVAPQTPVVPNVPVAQVAPAAQPSVTEFSPAVLEMARQLIEQGRQPQPAHRYPQTPTDEIPFNM